MTEGTGDENGAMEKGETENATAGRRDGEVAAVGRNCNPKTG